MNATQESLGLDIRSQIIEAAHARFSHYGYGKTTMSEIATDVSMSAANLYRYFKNKQEIIAECASRCMCDRVDRLRMAIKQAEMSAVERLKTYVLTDLQISHEMSENDRKINELIITITQKRPDLVYKKIESENILISEILSYGNETGEFNIDDIMATAQTIHTSLIVFNVPIFMSLYSHEQFKEKAIAVVELIVLGLAKRK